MLKQHAQMYDSEYNTLSYIHITHALTTNDNTEGTTVTSDVCVCEKCEGDQRVFT